MATSKKKTPVEELVAARQAQAAGITVNIVIPSQPAEVATPEADDAAEEKKRRKLERMFTLLEGRMAGIERLLSEFSKKQTHVSPSP